MSALSDARARIREQLVAGDVANVTLDPSTPLPFVLVDLIAVTGADGPGGWRGTCPIRVVAPGPGDADAARWLEDQCSAVLRTFIAATAVPERYPIGPDIDAPSYTVDVPVSIPNPDC
jgi:hypothetical protein